jgi:hypothetical protein
MQEEQKTWPLRHETGFLVRRKQMAQESESVRIRGRVDWDILMCCWRDGVEIRK